MRDARSGALVRQFTDKRPGRINPNFTSGATWQGGDLIVSAIHRRDQGGATSARP